MPTEDKRNRVYNARQKLRNRPRSVLLQDVADASGLSMEWVKAFSAGAHPNPHTKNLEKLEAYLKGQA